MEIPLACFKFSQAGRSCGSGRWMDIGAGGDLCWQMDNYVGSWMGKMGVVSGKDVLRRLFRVSWMGIWVFWGVRDSTRGVIG